MLEALLFDYCERSGVHLATKPKQGARAGKGGPK